MSKFEFIINLKTRSSSASPCPNAVRLRRRNHRIAAQFAAARIAANGPFEICSRTPKWSAYWGRFYEQLARAGQNERGHREIHPGGLISTPCVAGKGQFGVRRRWWPAVSERAPGAGQNKSWGARPRAGSGAALRMLLDTPYAQKKRPPHGGLSDILSRTGAPISIAAEIGPAGWII